MTPTERRYSERIGKLYWYTWNEYWPENRKSKMLVMVTGMKKAYVTTGKFLYNLITLQEENAKAWMKNGWSTECSGFKYAEATKEDIKKMVDGEPKSE